MADQQVEDNKLKEEDFKELVSNTEHYQPSMQNSRQPNFSRNASRKQSRIDEPGCMEQIVDGNSSVKGSKMATGINLLKNMVGIGILTLPYAFTWAGWLGGSIVLACVGYAAVYCCWVLMEVANQYQDKDPYFDPRNYQEFIEIVFQSRVWTYTINGLIFGGQLSDLIASCMFFTLYFQESFCHWELDEFCESRIPALVISLCIIFPLSFIRHFKSFKTFSVYGLMIIIISMLFVFYQGTVHSKTHPIDFDELAFFNYETFPLAVGIYAAAYETFAVYFDLRYSLEEPKEFPKVFLNVTHIVNALYISVGALGYIFFGEMTKDIILFNLPMTNYLFVFVVFLYCIQLSMTYSMHLFPLVVIGEMAFEDRDPYNLVQNEEEDEDEINEQGETDTGDNQNQNNNNNNNENQNNQDGEQTDEQRQQQQSQIEPRETSRSRGSKGSRGSRGSSRSRQERLEQEELESEDKPWEWHSVFIRVGYTIFIFSVTFMFKQVSLFFGLFGALCGIPMMFIVPLIIWELKSESKPTVYRIINFFILAVAVFNMVVGAYQNIIEIRNYFHFSLFF